MRFRFSVLVSLLVSLLGFAASGCTPEIGDKCVLSTDCSINGDRVCDTAQLDGYCTVFNCGPNGCPDEAACILFNPGVQGCGYDDRAALSRTGRTVCMKWCESDSDCRDGYVCADPKGPPWSALVIDDNQLKRVCITRPSSGRVGDVASVNTPDAPVCRATGPDAGTIDAGRRPRDGGADAGDGGAGDAGVDAGDAGTDAGADAGATDASGGG